MRLLDANSHPGVVERVIPQQILRVTERVQTLASVAGFRRHVGAQTHPLGNTSRNGSALADAEKRVHRLVHLDDLNGVGMGEGRADGRFSAMVGIPIRSY